MKSVTSVFSKIRAPRCLAPLAIDIVTSTGLARPSSGVQKPWMTSSVRISGTRSATSRGDSTSLVIPTERMYAVSRRKLSSARGVVASWRYPHCLKPVDSPVSSSSRAYSSAE